MIKINILIITFLNILCKETQAYKYYGDATAYGGIDGGFCGFKKVSNMHVALNSENWGNSLNCGRCVSISYENQDPVIAMITDKCPECKYGDLDLYEEVYKLTIKKSPGREKIKWDFVNCPSSFISENIKLGIDHINYYWLSIRPESFICGIKKMEILFDSEWIEMDRNDDAIYKKNNMNGLYFIYSNFIKTPFQLKLTSIYDDVIITSKYDKIENILLTNQQFKCNQHIDEIKENKYQKNNTLC